MSDILLLNVCLGLRGEHVGDLYGSLTTHFTKHMEEKYFAECNFRSWVTCEITLEFDILRGKKGATGTKYHMLGAMWESESFSSLLLCNIFKTTCSSSCFSSVLFCSHINTYTQNKIILMKREIFSSL